MNFGPDSLNVLVIRALASEVWERSSSLSYVHFFAPILDCSRLLVITLVHELTKVSVLT